ncbi:DUF6541 family protein [Actinokineospora inagensis]|uniref:DUF6541 family protein n=1 Tax=Actinokineospora inagensis TaxID=103730 RepID=UPI0004232E3C|nr:DUF6541 family protein [Actinokineospora inagensis]
MISIGEMVLLVLTTGAVMILPGLLVGLAVGLRGWLLWGVSPVVTYGVIGVAAPTLPKLGITWSPWTVLATTVVIAAIGFGVGRLLRRWDGRWVEREPVRPPWSRAHHLSVAASVLLGGGIGLFASYRASRGFSAVPQWFDAAYHANAIRFISDTGQSAPSALKVLTDPDASSYFYPNAFHALVALVRQIGGFGVVPALDVANGLVIGSFVLCMTILVKVCTNSPALTAVTAILSSTVTTFPYDIQVWGPLFPLVAGIALVPGFLALLHRALLERRFGHLFATALGAIGLLAIHSSVAVAAILLAGLLLIQHWITRRQRILPDLAAGVGIVVLAVLFGFNQITAFLGISVSADDVVWPPTSMPADGFGRLLGASRAVGYPAWSGPYSAWYPAWWFTAALVVGLIGVRKAKFRPVYWWLLGGLAFTVLYIMVAGYSTPLTRALSRPWWNDPWRIAALTTPGLIVLAAIGVVTARDGLAALVTKVWRPKPRAESTRPTEFTESAEAGDPGATAVVGDRRRALVPIVSLAVVLLVFGALSRGFYLPRNTDRLRWLYLDGPVVSHTKEDAMAWLSQHVPAGTVVANDPHDGSPWMWAIDGVQPLFKVSVIGPVPARKDGSNDAEVILRRLNQYDTDSSVRRAVDNLDISYVFVSKGSVKADPYAPVARGLQDLDRVTGLREVYRNVDSTIYQVTK